MSRSSYTGISRTRRGVHHGIVSYVTYSNPSRSPVCSSGSRSFIDCCFKHGRANEIYSSWDYYSMKTRVDVTRKKQWKDGGMVTVVPMGCRQVDIFDVEGEKAGEVVMILGCQWGKVY